MVFCKLWKTENYQQYFVWKYGTVLWNFDKYIDNISLHVVAGGEEEGGGWVDVSFGSSGIETTMKLSYIIFITNTVILLFKTSKQLFHI